MSKMFDATPVLGVAQMSTEGISSELQGFKNSQPVLFEQVAKLGVTTRRFKTQLPVSMIQAMQEMTAVVGAGFEPATPKAGLAPAPKNVVRILHKPTNPTLNM